MADELIRLVRDEPYPEGYTRIDNRDIWTSPDLKGVLVFRPITLGIFVAMWSLPRDWTFYESWLIEHLGVGRQRLQASLAELKEAGRLTQDKTRDPISGRFIGSKWELYRAASGRPPQVEKPQPGEPSPGQPLSGWPLIGISQLPSTDGKPITQPPTTEVGALLPASLDPDQKAVVGRIFALSGLRAEIQQQLADELCHATIRRGVANPVAYIKTLVARALSGEFVPDGALAIAKQRRDEEVAERHRRESAEQRRLTELKLAADRGDPEKQARIAALIAETSKSLGLASETRLAKVVGLSNSETEDATARQLSSIAQRKRPVGGGHG